LEYTAEGRQVQRLKDLQAKYDKKGIQWSTQEIDSFVAEYLNIYANLVTPSVHTSEIRELLKKPKMAKDKNTKDLVSDFYTIAQTITE
jgi:hypothetical protein